MQREQGRHQRAAPEGSGQDAPEPEQQHRVGGMEQHVGEVMSPGPQAEARHIRLVGQPGHRVPISGVPGGEGPGGIGPVETGLHLGVGRHIIRVIVIYEIEFQRRQVDRHRGGEEQEREDHNRATGWAMNSRREHVLWRGGRVRRFSHGWSKACDWRKLADRWVV